jgi:hypothetical protein
MHRKQRVDAPGLSSRNVLLTAAVSLALVAPAFADVTLQEKTVSTGLAGFGNGTSERTFVIAGDKSRSDDQYTYTGRFKTLAGGGKPKSKAQIVRLDREVMWDLEPAKKEYTELTFAQFREAMAKGMAEAQAEMDKPENQQAARDVEVTYKVDVQRTGKKDKINGFDAENFITTIVATPKDKKSGESAGSYTIRMDQWLSTQVPGQAETMAYYRKYAEKMGFDPQMQHQVAGMMRQYGDALKQAAVKLKDLKGYPVRSTVTLELGGGMTPEQQAQMDKERAEAQQKRAEEKSKKEAKEDDDAKAGTAGSLAKGNLGGALGGFLGRKLGKSAEKKAESGASSQGSGSGSPGGFTVTTDVLGITTGPAAVSFDVPSDFKKVERKN